MMPAVTEDAREETPDSSGDDGDANVSEDAVAVEARPVNAIDVSIDTDENGDGAAQIGHDPENVELWDPPSDFTVELTESHTVGITRVGVSGATPLSTVTVTVLPK